MINGKTVVYTSGTFDLIHENHIRVLEYAKSLGDILIVGVHSDEQVEKWKKRPILSLEERLSIVRSIKYVDIAIPQTNLDYTGLVKKLNVDVFLFGDDWAGKLDFLSKIGATVVYTPYSPGITSSEIRARVIARYEQGEDNKKTEQNHSAVDFY